MARIFLKMGNGSVYTGPTLKSVLEKNKGLSVFLNPQERKGAYQYAGKIAGERFAQVFLPLRFDPDYAKRLGYHVAPWYEEWKIINQGKRAVFGGKYGTLAGREAMVASPQPTPFRLSGSSEAAVLGRYSVVATSVKGNLTIRVRMPLGYIAFNKADVFTKILPHEYARVAAEVDRVLRLQLKTALEDEGYIDPRILRTQSRGDIDSAVRPSWIPERKAV